jgi:hypothetical protein
MLTDTEVADAARTLRSGALRSVKICGLRRIPAAALAEFVAELEARERVA